MSHAETYSLASQTETYSPSDHISQPARLMPSSFHPGGNSDRKMQWEDGSETCPAPPFDEERFRNEIGDATLMRELITAFLEDSQTLLAEACRSITRQDVESLHCAAHALKGLVGNYSAPPAYEAVSLLTALSREGNLDLAAELLPGTVEECLRLAQALRQFFNRLLAS